MPRPLKHEREVLLDRALGVFWSRGYEGASVEELVRAMEVHPGTLYHLFGDKHGLFREALDRYEATVGDYFVRRLEKEGADLPALRRFFDAAAEMLARDEGRRGCLLTNAAMERGPEDPEVAGRAARYFERVERAFEAALRRAQDAGQLPRRTDADLRAAARHLGSVLLGIRVLAKAGASAGELRPAARVALAGLSCPVD